MNQPNKGNILSQIQTAFQLIEKGNTEDARAVFNQLAHYNISDLNILTQLGALAMQLDEKIIAINTFSKLVDLKPDNASYLDMLANATINNGDFESAKKLLHKAIELKPDFAEPYKRLGAIAIRQKDYAEGTRLLERAMKLKPRDPVIVSNIIIALRFIDRHDDALKYAQKLVRLDPKNPNSHETLGRVLIDLGDTKEAAINLEKAIRLDKTYGSSYNLLASTKKFSEQDSAFIKQCEHALTLSMSSSQRFQIHFALGKIYDDCKKWDKAFKHYRLGNLLGKPTIDEDKAILGRFKKIRKNYTEKLFKQASGLGSESDIPVFVVGMPRSGTTLIEQIIFSHPQGAGAGELTEIYSIDKQICPTESPSDYRKHLHDNLKKDIIQKYTEGYLEALKKNRQHASHIVDKLPDNFFRLGLIDLLFPNAHIIHAIRNPLDTCLSCYFRPFGSVYWSYDLKWIANRYRFYRETMDYWKKTLPKARIIDVHYDKIIEDPVNQTRRIIESIGLPWDERCLEFYKKKRAIVTESVWQARQPIYSSSSGRWKNYAPFLQELANELSDYLVVEEIEELKDHGINVKNKTGRSYLRNILAR